MNVMASAGGAARSANDLNMLLLSARKQMGAENQLSTQGAKDRDIEYGRSLTNQLSTQDATSRQIQAGLAIFKTVLAIAKIVGGALSSGGADDAAKDATSQAGQTASETANSTLKTVGTVASATLAIASQVVALVGNIADLNKANKDKHMLTEDQASMDSATKSLDTTGRA